MRERRNVEGDQFDARLQECIVLVEGVFAEIRGITDVEREALNVLINRALQSAGLRGDWRDEAARAELDARAEADYNASQNAQG